MSTAIPLVVAHPLATDWKAVRLDSQRDTKWTVYRDGDDEPRGEYRRLRDALDFIEKASGKRIPAGLYLTP
jgi:hypothetical protein